MRLKLIALLPLLLSYPAFGVQQVIIIGGGPTPMESEVSIHLNTEWIVGLTKQINPDLISNIFFTDGNAPGYDVRMQDTNEEDYASLKPLSAVYGSNLENSYRFYSSNVATSAKTTEKNVLVSELTEIFKNLGAADELMLIFQGHGDHNRSDTSGNTLRLWNDTRLSVTELEELMSLADPGSTIRFLLPQCFSGGFAKLIYKNANVNDGLAAGKRCGFLAQSEHLDSEGCTVSVDTSDYTDYSSYFFAAITGKKIDGQVLTIHADSNYDGSVSMKEAHYYALSNAFSIDYSRSTSEDYLERWQPWYLKWMPDRSEPDNVYQQISRNIAKRYNFQGSGNQLTSAVSDRLNALEQQAKNIKESISDLENKIKSAQKQIRRDLELRWPQLSKPYTAQFIYIINNEINEINAYINTHTEYQTLIDNINRFNGLQLSSLDTRRETTQMMKILRMRNMARLLEKFEQFASENEISEYKELVACEDAKYINY